MLTIILAIEGRTGKEAPRLSRGRISRNQIGDRLRRQSICPKCAPRPSKLPISSQKDPIEMLVRVAAAAALSLSASVIVLSGAMTIDDREHQGGPLVIVYFFIALTLLPVAMLIGLRQSPSLAAT